MTVTEYNGKDHMQHEKEGPPTMWNVLFVDEYHVEFDEMQQKYLTKKTHKKLCKVSSCVPTSAIRVSQQKGHHKSQTRIFRDVNLGANIACTILSTDCSNTGQHDWEDHMQQEKRRSPNYAECAICRWISCWVGEMQLKYLTNKLRFQECAWASHFCHPSFTM